LHVKKRRGSDLKGGGGCTKNLGAERRPGKKKSLSRLDRKSEKGDEEENPHEKEERKGKAFSKNIRRG